MSGGGRAAEAAGTEPAGPARARDAARGIAAMVTASVIWGLSPLFYKSFAEVPPLEVLSHRTLWSLLFFGVLLALQGRLGAVPRALKGRGAAVIVIAAVMISTNWFLYIFSIQAGHTVEASLGYYIFPLVAVLIGVFGFGERLGPARAAAVGLAALAVVVLSWGLGAAPWIALTLATTFGLYGLIKKRLAVGPVVSVTAEVLILAPLAVIWLIGAHGAGWTEAGRPGGYFGRELGTSLLLAGSGLLTAGPLILFSYATRRVGMATVGLIQYVNPTLQFLCAVIAFAEPFTRWHAIAFALIWAALAIYSVAGFRGARGQASAEASADSSAPTSATGIR